jgi:novel plant SNARE
VLTSSIQRLSDSIDELKNTKLKARGKADKLRQCETLMARYTDLKKSFRLEMQTLPAAGKDTYKKKLKGFEGRVKKLHTEYRWHKNEGDRSELMGERRKDAASRPKDGDGLVDATLGVQDKTKKSLGRTLGMIHSAESTAVETAAELAAQTQQMGRIDDNLERIQDDLHRSRALITSFAKRMMTDRIILCMLFLVVVGLAAIIIISAVDPDSDVGSNVPDAAKPPDPNDVRHDVGALLRLRG